MMTSEGKLRAIANLAPRVLSLLRENFHEVEKEYPGNEVGQLPDFIP